MNAPHLPTCRKIVYVSIAEARQAVKSTKNRGGGYARTYQCGDCGYWHLTSRPTRATVKKGW